MCHNAWQRHACVTQGIHVSQCMAKACMCDTWQAMCLTHGLPCVNMHGTFEAYIYGVSNSVVGGGGGGGG